MIWEFGFAGWTSRKSELKNKDEMTKRIVGFMVNFGDKEYFHFNIGCFFFMNSCFAVNMFQFQSIIT
jgi:hypothetical protein